MKEVLNRSSEKGLYFMDRNVQVFTNSQKTFIFCDYDWQPIDDKSQLVAQPVDIYFRQQNGIYSWECGTCSNNLIAAYLKYGERFAEYGPVGNSSFVLYDSIHNSTIAVRDFLGKYPLYYCAPPSNNSKETFIFTFSIQVLLRSKLVEPVINYAKVVEFIDYYPQARPNNYTFYRHVYRLLPAHWVCIQQNQLKHPKRYGQFDVSKYRAFTDEAFTERFRELFIQSVKRTTDGYQKVGATLSGGLDSSAVCSVAQSLRNEPVSTFNFNPQTPEAQEDEYIQAVGEKWGNVHQTVQSSYSDYEAIQKITALYAQPFFAFNYTIQLDLIAAARQHHCDVFLSGHWGDQVVSHGLRYLDELVLQKDWPQLKQSIAQHLSHPFYDRQLDQQGSVDETQLSKSFTAELLVRTLKRKNKWASYAYISWILAAHFDFTIADLLAVIRQKTKKNTQIPRPSAEQIVQPTVLLQRDSILREDPVEVLDINTTVNGPTNFSQWHYLDGVFRSNEIYGQEEYFEIYRQHSIRSAQPFLDAELIELNLSVPLRLKFDEGRKRGTIRRALGSYLPEKIARRTTKGVFTNHYVSLFKTLWQDFERRTSIEHPVWKLINKRVFDEHVKTLIDDRYTSSGNYILLPSLVRVIKLAIWLDYLEQLKK